MWSRLLLFIIFIAYGFCAKDLGQVLTPCFSMPKWYSCKNKSSNLCFSPSQLCDGRLDCFDTGWDEDPRICSSFACPLSSVRCATAPICIRLPHRQVCNTNLPSRCPDRSDKSNCFHKIYTGCFLHDPMLGLSLSHCDDCFCKLVDKKNHSNGTKNSHAKPWMFKSITGGHQGTHVSGNVCLARDDERLCDGIVDCIGGLDEDAHVCSTKKDPYTSHDIMVWAVLFVATMLCIFVYAVICCIVYGCQKTFERNRQVSKQQRDQSDVQDANVTMDSNWNWNKAQLIRKLGKGFFSSVYLAQEVSGRLVAVKCSSSRTTMSPYGTEVRILLHLGSHPSIIRLMGTDRDHQLAVFEYCENGNLKRYLEKFRAHFVDEVDPIYGEVQFTGLIPSPNRSSSVAGDEDQDKFYCPPDALNTRQLLKWTMDLVKAMIYLGEKGVVHGDVALRNILLTRWNTIKLSDFGLSFTHQSKTSKNSDDVDLVTQKPLPLAWLAPECIQNPKELSLRSDVWSFGVTIWELFSLGQNPYSHLESSDQLLSWLSSGNRLSLPNLAPKTIQCLIKSCWHDDPAIRPGFVSILDGLHSSYLSQLSTQRPHSDSGILNDSLEHLNGRTFNGGYIPMTSLFDLDCSPSIRGSASVRTDSVSYWNGYKLLTSHE